MSMLGNNLVVYCFRIKSVDWIYLLSTKFPDELTTHLKLFKQSRVRLKHVDLLNAKEISNGNMRPSPKKEEKRTHRRNKSETDLLWSPGEHLRKPFYLQIFLVWIILGFNLQLNSIILCYVDISIN